MLLPGDISYYCPGICTLNNDKGKYFIWDFFISLQKRKKIKFQICQKTQLFGLGRRQNFEEKNLTHF